MKVEQRKTTIKKIIAALPVLLLAATATPALAAPHHRAPAPYGTVHSGRSAPQNWNDIEISHPEGGG